MKSRSLTPLVVPVTLFLTFVLHAVLSQQFRTAFPQIEAEYRNLASLVLLGCLMLIWGLIALKVESNTFCLFAALVAVGAMSLRSSIEFAAKASGSEVLDITRQPQKSIWTGLCMLIAWLAAHYLLLWTCPAWRREVMEGEAASSSTTT